MAAKFTIKCNSRDYFRYLLELLRVFNPFKKLDNRTCLLYTSDAADDLLCVDLGGRRIIKKQNI